jgi:hypothetical protein
VGGGCLGVIGGLRDWVRGFGAWCLVFIEVEFESVVLHSGAIIYVLECRRCSYYFSCIQCNHVIFDLLEDRDINMCHNTNINLQQ